MSAPQVAPEVAAGAETRAGRRALLLEPEVIRPHICGQSHATCWIFGLSRTARGGAKWQQKWQRDSGHERLGGSGKTAQMRPRAEVV